MPMFQLSKTDRKRVTAAAKRITEPAATLMVAIEAYNEAVGPFRELARAIEADWQAVWDKRSERWQDSAEGQTATETIAAWGMLADSLEDIEVEVVPEIAIPE